MIERRSAEEEWWEQKICPHMSYPVARSSMDWNQPVYCYGSSCAFWVQTKLENDKKHGVCTG